MYSVMKTESYHKIQCRLFQGINTDPIVLLLTIIGIKAIMLPRRSICPIHSHYIHMCVYEPSTVTLHTVNLKECRGTESKAYLDRRTLDQECLPSAKSP